MLLAELLQAASGQLAAAGVEQPRLEAELMAAHVLRTDRAGVLSKLTSDIVSEAKLLVAHTSASMPASAKFDLALFNAFIARRLAREPLPYILGEAQFYGLTLFVDRRVLIPRPETELLVEEALRLIKEWPPLPSASGVSPLPDRSGQALARRGEPHPFGDPSLRSGLRLRAGSSPLHINGEGIREKTKLEREERLIMAGPVVADIGTGSGAIAIAMAHASGIPSLFATDLSELALAVAAKNVARYGFERRVTLLQGDLLAPLLVRPDIVLANLPYVRSGSLPELQPEIARYEPVMALDGGPDGLDLIRRLWSQALARYGAGSGVAFLLEHEDNQAPTVLDIVRQPARQIADLAGLKRLTLAYL